MNIKPKHQYMVQQKDLEQAIKEMGFTEHINWCNTLREEAAKMGSICLLYGGEGGGSWSHSGFSHHPKPIPYVSNQLISGLMEALNV